MHHWRTAPRPRGTHGRESTGPAPDRHAPGKHAHPSASRMAHMHTHHRLALPLVLACLLAACAATLDFSSSEPDRAHEASTSVSARPSSSVAPRTEGSEPTATPHDMAEMGAETVTVDIANFAFVPAELVISAGTEVVFTNSDSAPHTVTAGSDRDPTPELFDSGLLEQGDAFSVTFDEPGEFAYFCDRHPPMTGTVVVEG